jgi:hypothetical protein
MPLRFRLCRTHGSFPSCPHGTKGRPPSRFLSRSSRQGYASSPSRFLGLPSLELVTGSTVKAHEARPGREHREKGAKGGHRSCRTCDRSRARETASHRVLFAPTASASSPAYPCLIDSNAAAHARTAAFEMKVAARSPFVLERDSKDRDQEDKTFSRDGLGTGRARGRQSQCYEIPSASIIAAVGLTPAAVFLPWRRLFPPPGCGLCPQRR